MLSQIEILRTKRDELEERLLEDMQQQTKAFETENGITIKDIICCFQELPRRMERPWVRYGLASIEIELEDI